MWVDLKQGESHEKVFPIINAVAAIALNNGVKVDIGAPVRTKPRTLALTCLR